MRSNRIVLPLAAALVLLLGMPFTAAQQKKAAKKAPPAEVAAAAAHPAVDGEETCQSCHEGVTAELVADWNEGAHGMNNVLCVVCHGSLENFIKAPDATRCAGCHAAQVETMATDFMNGKTCFTCHPAHRLLPHAELPKPDPGVRDRSVEGGAQ